MDKALTSTKEHYPSVFDQNENIYFKLKCRKFIELIRRCTELQPSTKGKRRSSASSPPLDPFNGTMDLDDAADDDEMDTDADAAPDTYMEQTTLMNDALKYGQELQSEFKGDPRKEVKQALEDTFALIAYPDARESSLAPLLEPEGRIPVAEELNSAILGKSLLR